MTKAVVIIVLEGGLVQAICCAEPLPGLRFEVIDYDTEGADPEEITPMPFTDGTTTGACRRTEVLSSPSDIDWTRFGLEA